MNTNHVAPVIDMHAWRAARAGRRWQDAQEHAGANPDSQDARDYARVAALEYTRAVMQRHAAERNAADRKRRLEATQAIADQLRNKTFQDLRSPDQR